MQKIRALWFLLFILTLPLAGAGAEVTYSLDPRIIKVVIPPGGSYSGLIKVYARSRERIKIKAYLADCAYMESYDGTRAFFPAKSTALSCTDWITFSPAEFVIPTYEIGRVNYLINMPRDAQGGHYAVLFFETLIASPANIAFKQKMQAAVTANLRLGAIFYLEAKGTVKRTIDLGKFSLSKDPRRKTYSLASSFKNTGNADIITGGTFHIMDKKGKIIARGKFQDTYTMPGDKAEVKAEYKDVLPKGKYDIVVTIGLAAGGENKKISRGGTFTKEAEVEIGENGELLSSTEFK